MAPIEQDRLAMTPIVAQRTALAMKNLSHPGRLRVLERITQDAPASPSAVAGDLGEKVPNVSYHVGVLVALGAITLESTTQRRGAIEHYYAPTDTGRELLQLAYEWAAV